MNNFKILLMLVLALSPFYAMAQSYRVTGKVTDASDNSPLIGVTVVARESGNGVATGLDGTYSLTVTAADLYLDFNYIGMEPVAVSLVGGQTEYNVGMTETAERIDDVVVVGYGSQRKSDVTGAVASVSAEDMLAVPTTNIAEMIRGRVAGVQVSQSSSRPGGTSEIMIRGQRSLSAGNSPLYIVDGVPMDNIDDINPNDILTLDILKDASSQAIYGARASAGVVLVTTRRGHAGKTTVDFSAQFTYQTLKKNFDLFSGEELIGMYLAQNGVYGGIKDASEAEIESAINDNMVYANYAAGKYTNWEKELIKPAWQQQYNVSIRGGTEATRVMVSLNYYKQNGIIKSSGYQRGSMRVNVDHKITESIAIGANISFNRFEQENETGTGNIIMQALTASPYSTPYDDDGNLLKIINSVGKYNPLWNLRESSDVRIGNNFMGNIFGEWMIIKGLKYRINGSLSTTNSKRKMYRTREHSEGYTKDGAGTFTFVDQREWLIENILTYDKQINANHKFDVTLVQSANSRRSENYTQNAEKFLTDYFGVNGIENASTILTPSLGIVPRQLASFMGRVRYTIKDRYLFTASLRADGSSVFGPDNKWGYFPSAAFAWRVSEEDFLKYNPIISNLKLRLSYGVVGNQGVGPYQTVSNTNGSIMMFGGQSAYSQGLLPSLTMANPNLKWESTASYNVGLDFGLFDNRLNGSAEYYYTRTSDLLVARALSSSTGYASQMINLGKTENKGIELQLSGVIINNRDFRWTADLTFSKNTNKILKIDGRRDDDGKLLDQPNNLWFIGQPIDLYYDYKFDGIFNSVDEVRNSAQGKDVNGDPLPDDQLQNKVGTIKIKGSNKDGFITEDDKGFYYKSPKWFGSFATTFSYKGIDLLIDVFTSQGATLQNNYLWHSDYGGAYINKLNGIKRNYWTPTGQGQEAPLPRANNADPNMIVLGYQDASYVRIRTIQLGYTFPRQLTNKIGATNVRVFATLSNYFTWTDYESFGPESTLQQYPEPKSVTFGINFSF